MAPIFEQLSARVDDGKTDPPYISAIILATVSILMILLILPAMLWHFRNRNIGATMLVAWVIILNFQSFINAVIWSNDDTDSWYNGVGLCDVEVKLTVASTVATQASLCCILRALAEVMDTKRTTLVKTKAQKCRAYAVELLLCLGFPALQMILHYIVQSKRYYLYGISGCVPEVDASWLAIPLIYLPPIVWTFVDAYYAIVILVRLYQYRQAFTSILRTSNMPKSRFTRLYVLCILWTLALAPASVYVLYLNLVAANSAVSPFSWDVVHDSANSSQIVFVPSHGTITYDRYIWLAQAVIVFAFFGFGKEAVGMYRSGMIALGFDRVFPGLRPDHARQGSVTSRVSSFGSKARLLFKRKSFASSSLFTDTITTTTSRTLSNVDPLSPKNMSFLDPVSEDQKVGASMASASNAAELTPHHDAEKTQVIASSSPIWRRLTTLFTTKHTSNDSTANETVLHALTGQQAIVRSKISSSTGSPSSPDEVQSIGPIEVVVRKEVRQGSETAESFHAC